MPMSPASTPNLSMQGPMTDPISKRGVLDDMYQDIKWLIDDQHITHLRRKVPVILDVLKQVINNLHSVLTVGRCCSGSRVADCWSANVSRNF